MCHYKNAVAAYRMARRFIGINAYEAESYRLMMLSCVRKYIAATECLTEADFEAVRKEVIWEAFQDLRREPIAA